MSFTNIASHSLESNYEINYPSTSDIYFAESSVDDNAFNVVFFWYIQFTKKNICISVTTHLHNTLHTNVAVSGPSGFNILRASCSDYVHPVRVNIP